MNTFHCKPMIFFGEGALAQLSTCKADSVMLVTDRFFEESGFAAKIASRIPNARLTIFSDVTPDPSLELVAKGLAVFQACKPDVFIALGGGSPIDCAKAILYLQDTRPLFICIPTTSGTGSEVTSFSIVTSSGKKQPIVDAAMLPDWAILDASLLEKLPKTLIADAGMDVLSHCLEAIAATGASNFSDALAEKSFRICFTRLDASYAGDLRVRAAIHESATMAGIAFDHAGLGISHSLAHALGGRFHIAHGRLNAILLPAVLAYNADACLPRYLALARLCGISGATDKLLFRNFIAAIERLRGTVSMPATLSQAGIAASDFDAALDAVANAALLDPCTATNPKKPTLDELKEILRQVK